MFAGQNAFISRSYLRSVWALDYDAFKDTAEERNLEERLQRWSQRTDLKETSAEAAFIDVFFRDTWGYAQSGQDGGEDGFTLYPKFSIAGAGAKGGVGEADLAVGYFANQSSDPVPQVLCEFKDVHSALDVQQKRKGNSRSPVKQCLDYLSASRRGMFGNEPILPTWALVTDMNEFRLYWYDRAPRQYLSFTIRPTDLFQGVGLLGSNEEARFDRFLFWRIFRKETLLTAGGQSLLLTLIRQQRFRDRELENTFYAEYTKFRERLYTALLLSNPPESERFPGTRGKLVRLAQKILDRCIFIFFCEDMGQALAFPPKLLRDFLIARATDPYFNPEGGTIWQELLILFEAMNSGSAFAGRALNQFNGGLFARDEELERLYVPNSIFCQPGQGQNEATLYTYKETLLYLCASYNYASEWSQGSPRNAGHGDVGHYDRDPSKSLGLYTLGRIFEQSITELEILEAEADDKPSINKVSQRKRDGVYYTPEWVVDRIVAETVGVRLDEIKLECGWRPESLPTLAALDAFTERLSNFTVLDPACGSGAFLITSLRYLLDAWHEVQAIRTQMGGRLVMTEDALLVRDILSRNIYGVDINPSSIEIARLALWLHTARGDKPLSSLDETVRDGNSLIDSQFFNGQINLAFYGAAERERVNAFDWVASFPEISARGGFDAVVSNPPYVKLQNFRQVHADIAEYLRRDKLGRPTYESTQTGNFDLYLPFIEKGLSLLNNGGRLGYIAPSLWTVNEYGEGLRNFVMRTKTLDRWLDFKAYQVFEEATTYTALQFFSKSPNQFVRVANVPDGAIPFSPWANADSALPYEKLSFGDRWLLLTGHERELIDRLSARCLNLDDVRISSAIFVGIQTSADAIYHLQKLGPGRYMCHPKGKDAPPPYEVLLEDAVMKPLISGEDVKRYIEPKPETYVLFPYFQDNNEMRLIDARTFEAKFPRAWAYLRSYEDSLRAREDRAMDDDDLWWGYNYPKNLEKQSHPKIVIPRLVANLSCSVDREGEFYLDNVDVGGIKVGPDIDPFFIAALLNSPVLGFVFRRISKPFRGSYLSANRQFISPLPIALADSNTRREIANKARELQTIHSRKRDITDRLAHRLRSVRFRSKPETWLFPKSRSRRELDDLVPKNLPTDERHDWVDRHYEEQFLPHYESISNRLNLDATLAADFSEGELSFSIDGVRIVDSIFVGDQEGTFILAQWNLLVSTFSITDKTTGRKLCNALRRLAMTDNPELIRQIIELQQELHTTEAQIDHQEADINAVIYRSYGLSSEDIAMISKERLQRL